MTCFVDTCFNVSCRVTPEASYNCGAVLSSLSWRDPHVISYTVDQGRLELLDIRSRYTSLIMATETTVSTTNSSLCVSDNLSNDNDLMNDYLK